MAVTGVCAGSLAAAPRGYSKRAGAMVDNGRRPRQPSLNRSAAWHIAAALILTLWAHGALATTYHPVDLKTCVDAAEVIFAGTVTQMVAVEDSGSIITRVTLSDVAHVRGKPDSGDVVLRVLGGTVARREPGGRVDSVRTGMPADGPVFHTGVRYVVLAKGDLGSFRDIFLPIVYFNQGLFTVKPDRPNGPPVVHFGLPIVAYRDGHVVVVRRPAASDSTTEPDTTRAAARGPASSQGNVESRPFVWYGLQGRVALEVIDSRADPGTRFSEEQFLALLREIGSSR